MGTMLTTPLCCEKGVRPNPDASNGVNLTGEGPVRDGTEIQQISIPLEARRVQVLSINGNDLPIPGENKLGENNLPWPEAGSSIPR